MKKMIRIVAIILILICWGEQLDHGTIVSRLFGSVFGNNTEIGNKQDHKFFPTEQTIIPEQSNSLSKGTVKILVESAPQEKSEKKVEPSSSGIEKNGTEKSRIEKPSFWSQFRGPNGTGIFSSKAPLPIEWSESKNIRWKTPIHDKGWSSPVIWGNQIWLTTALENGKEMFAVCLDVATGKIVHDLKVIETVKPEFCHPTNSYASPTPVIEEGRVYLHFGTYGTICLNTQTGKEIWQRTDLHCDHFRGPASSPILFDQLIIVPFDGIDVQFVVALNKNTGETVWKLERAIDYQTKVGDMKKGYGTASVLTIEGKPQLISSAAKATIAYDPYTGKEIWKVYHGGMNTTAPPLLYKDRIFICTGDGGDRLVCVRTGGHGDITKTHVLWKSNRGIPSRSSPILIGDQLVMVNENGVLTILDTETGKVLQQERVGGRYWASPIYDNHHLYLIDDEGMARIGVLKPKWELIAKNKLDQGCMGTPAIIDGALLVRTKTHLYCIANNK